MRKLLSDSRLQVHMRIFGVLTIIVFVLMVTVSFEYYDNNSNLEEIVDDNDFYDYKSYYESPSLGENLFSSIMVLINESTIPNCQLLSQCLYIYGYKPPNLNTSDDAVKYLEDYSFMVDKCTQDVDKTYGYTVYVFYNDSVHFGLYPNGRIIVSYNLSAYEESNSNLSKDEAIQIATRYLNDHKMLPKSNYTCDISAAEVTDISTNISTNISYYIHYNQVLDNCSVYPHIYENKIIIKIDALKSVVRSVQYHWPEFYVKCQINETDRIPINEIVHDYVDQYNKNVSTAYTVNITNVAIIYSKIVDISIKEVNTNSHYFLCVPYVLVEWETGMTFLSPLKK